MDGLWRLPHGIAQELLAQRRLALRSLGVVGTSPRILEPPLFLRRVQVQPHSKRCLRPYACSTALMGFQTLLEQP